MLETKPHYKYLVAKCLGALKSRPWSCLLFVEYLTKNLTLSTVFMTVAFTVQLRRAKSRTLTSHYGLLRHKKPRNHICWHVHECEQSFFGQKIQVFCFFLKSMTGEQHTHIDHTQPVFHNKRVQRLGEAVRIARSYVRQTNRVCDEGTQRWKPDHHEYQFGGGFGPR